MTGPILYCGDPHGHFHHIVEAVATTNASAVVLLGDLEPKRSLAAELAPIVARGVQTWFIHGNHDADTDACWELVGSAEVASQNVHCRLVKLPNGQSLAGLGGVFRKSVWYPKPGTEQDCPPVFRGRVEHAKATPRQDRWLGVHHHRKHFGTIYPEEVERLADLRSDVLITHEAPGYHPNGFETIDSLARSMAAKVVVHGHQHDCIDSSYRWASQGFRSFGVGLRGVTAIDADGNAEVIIKGEEAVMPVLTRRIETGQGRDAVLAPSMARPSS